MTPVMQTKPHDPPESYGDCHRAAVASLLDLPIEVVPHFMDGLASDNGETFQLRQNEFLRSRGLEAIQFPILDQGASVTDVCRAAEAWNPGKTFLLGGESATGCGHTVVADGSGIVHDPGPKKPGIVGPMNDGCFWITYIVGRIG